MVFYNGRKVKTKRALTTINNIGDIEKLEIIDFNYLKNILGINQKIEFNLKMLNGCFELIKKFDYTIVRFVNDINEIGNDFCLDRYEKFLDFKKNNKYSISKDFYIFKFGSIRGLKLFEERIDRIRKFSPYREEYWINKGYTSESEITEKVKEYKKSKATSLAGFVERYGKDEGVKKYEKFKSTSKHTLEKYLSLYGLEEGNARWLEYLETKRNTSVFTKNYWVNKGFSVEDAEKMRKEFHNEKLNTKTFDFWVRKGLSLDAAKNKLNEIDNKKGVKFRSASKASLKIFMPVVEYFKNLDFKLGIKGNNEFSIFNDKNKKYYYYDLTIPSLNLIFEYHGERFHPHFSITERDDLIKWESLYLVRVENSFKKSKKNGLEIRENDILKEQLAINNGFKYHVVWSSDDKNEAINKIINIIKNESSKNQ